MSTLADADVRTACRSRIHRLSPEARARWGRMTARQMVCHLNDSFLVAMGDKHASPASNILQRTFIKWVALRTPLRWPPNVPTRPEIEQGIGGTPPAEWETDCAELMRLMEAFGGCQTFGEHPAFGKLSPRDWLTWGYRHVDHHLRQFGA